MPQSIDSDLSVARQKRYAVVCARFNELVVEQLLKGCVDELRHFGVADERITVAWAPGAFEIPLIARRLASRAEFDAVICLGAVIRGDTPHFDYVAAEAAKGVAQAAWQCDKPVIFGVLTTNSLEQALERAGSKGGNKGRDAARAALEMVALFDQLPACAATERGPTGRPVKAR